MFGKMLLLIFRPAQFSEDSRRDAQSTGAKSSGDVFASATAQVRRALLESFILVAGAAGAAALVGALACEAFGPLGPGADRALQIAGVGILLWATLAKQGWNIQTIKGISLPELVDQWMYRTLYTIGTFVLTLSLSWCGGAS